MEGHSSPYRHLGAIGGQLAGKYGHLAMYTLSDLEGELGLSRHQLRARLTALAAVDGQLGAKIGPRGRKLYPPETVEFLRELDRLTNAGFSLTEAGRQVAAKLGDKGALESEGNLNPDLTKELRRLRWTIAIAALAGLGLGIAALVLRT